MRRKSVSAYLKWCVSADLALFRVTTKQLLLFFHSMFYFSGLKVLTLFEGFAVGGHTVEAYPPPPKKKGVVEIESFSGSVVGTNEVCVGAGGGWGKGREGHCFRCELSLDLKQSRVSAATIS